MEDSEASASAATSLGATVLPLSECSFPSSVEVEAGKNTKTFYLSIPKTFVDKNEGIYVLALRLDSPSAYELSSKGTMVVVVIDTDAIKNIEE